MRGDVIVKLSSLFSLLSALSEAQIFHSDRESPSAYIHFFCPASVNLFEFPSCALFEYQIFFRDKYLWFCVPLASFIHCSCQIQTKPAHGSLKRCD